MAFKIVTADERLSQSQFVKGVIFGPHGVGKTSLLWTMDPKTTLFLNLEAGEKAVQDWPGDSIEIKSWRQAVDIACLASGPDESLILHADGSWPEYSKPHYDYLVESNPGMVEFLAKYQTHFWDSISVASRLAWKWALGQPGSYSEKTGKPDTRGTYRIIGQDIVSWLTRIQHTKRKNIWVVGGLDLVRDDFGREYWAPQIEGSKAGREILGIFDEVISMVNMQAEDGSLYRAFVCWQQNPWRYPAKDRSGRLEMIEQPHLGRLMEKLNGPVTPAVERLTYQMPEQAAA
jgi:AAA domain